MTVNTDQIATMNDDLRRDLTLGTAVMTVGVAALGPEFIERVVRTVATYDKFDEGNNPNGERDLGCFELDGHRLLWKVDYFDKSMTYHSPDPSDPTVTERVITLMLAEEY